MEACLLINCQFLRNTNSQNMFPLHNVHLFLLLMNKFVQEQVLWREIPNNTIEYNRYS